MLKSLHIDIPQVSVKNTKAEILTAYQKLLAAIKEPRVRESRKGALFTYKHCHPDLFHSGSGIGGSGISGIEIEWNTPKYTSEAYLHLGKVFW